MTTVSEFKAWFEGFTEAMDGPPDAKQWERIVSKIKAIDGTPMPTVVIRENYYRFRPFWPPGVYFGNVAAMPAASFEGMNDDQKGDMVYNLGRAEYRALA